MARPVQQIQADLAAATAKFNADSGDYTACLNSVPPTDPGYQANVSGCNNAYATLLQDDALKLQDLQQELAAALAQLPPATTPGGGGGGTGGAGGGVTVNIDLTPVVAAINAFDYAFQVNFLPYFTGDLINAIKGAGGSGNLGQYFHDDVGRGLAEILDQISIDIGKLQVAWGTEGALYRAIAPIGAALTASSDPPIVAWATTAGIATDQGKRNAAAPADNDWTHVIWNQVQAAIAGLRNPLIDALKGTLSLVHLPGKELGGLMAGFLIDEVAGDVGLVAVSQLSDALDNAQRLWKTMYGLGMSAHLFAEMGELAHPFKELGLPQAAAFAVDMSGFNRVGASIMGALTEAGVGIPIRYHALGKAMPEIPGFRQLSTMFRRSAIDEASAKEALSWHGFSPAWADRFIQSWFAAPSLGDLSLALQDSDVDSAWVATALDQHGYSSDDVDVLTKGLEKKILNPYRTRAITAAMSLHTKGLMSDQDLRNEMASLGLRPEAIDLLAKAGAWDARATLVADATAEFTTMYQNGLLDDQAFAVALTGLGYTDARATIIVAVQQVKRSGRIAAKKEAAQAKVTGEFQKESVQLYRLQFDAGALDAGGYLAALTAIGLDQAVAQAIVSIDQIRQTEKTAAVKTSEAQALKDRIQRETISALEDQYRKKLISLEQLSGGLASMGMDTTLVAAIVAKEFALGIPPPRVNIKPPTELLVQKITARARTVILTELKKGIIDQARATEELVALPEDPRLAAEDVQLALAQSHRIPRAVTETPDQKAVRTATKGKLLVEYRSGVLDEGGLAAGLVAAGYSGDLSDALVSLEVAKKEARAAAAAAAAAKKASPKTAA